MNLDNPPNSHLTYCTNIHPGETLSEIEGYLETHVSKVKADICPNDPFGLGLRLSAQAARKLDQAGRIYQFKEKLAQLGFYIFTLNGFPYGDFSGKSVKENVYLPDWTSESRLEYSNLLAEHLAALLPDDPKTEGTISTVPGGFAELIKTEREVGQIVEMLTRHAAFLFSIKNKTGKKISLELEPEPLCFLETTDQVVRFFEERLFCRDSAKRLSVLTGMSIGQSERFWHEHFGVCFDSCHMALQYEDPEQSILKLMSAGVRIGKVQLSAGLVVPKVTPDAVESLWSFADNVYLHQIVEKSTSGIKRFADLPAALESYQESGVDRQWRIHFHVPIFAAELGGFSNTQAFLKELISILSTKGTTRHFEVETYTWDVLPARYRQTDVIQSIIRELQWVKNQVNG